MKPIGYSFQEYIRMIKRGEAAYIMLVNSHNQVVDIDGNPVYV